VGESDALHLVVGTGWIHQHRGSHADHRESCSGIASLVACSIFIVSRLLAFILSRHLCCPLCMGKVMASVRCHKHVNAQRLPPLTYRATAVLAVLFTLSFRCMYCGTRFRLRK
jgi:hypothetical protein